MSVHVPLWTSLQLNLVDSFLHLPNLGFMLLKSLVIYCDNIDAIHLCWELKILVTFHWKQSISHKEIKICCNRFSLRLGTNQNGMQWVAVAHLLRGSTSGYSWMNAPFRAHISPNSWTRLVSIRSFILREHIEGNKYYCTKYVCNLLYLYTSTVLRYWLYLDSFIVCTLYILDISCQMNCIPLF